MDTVYGITQHAVCKLKLWGRIVIPILSCAILSSSNTVLLLTLLTFLTLPTLPSSLSLHLIDTAFILFLSHPTNDPNTVPKHSPSPPKPPPRLPSPCFTLSPLPHKITLTRSLTLTHSLTPLPAKRTHPSIHSRGTPSVSTPALEVLY